ncbi:MAG: hypothetical protein A2Y13_09280 [Planctomycetes bacterium GWC2_45_44]|nr:MAG: hypothetical protein A2Y13_09280 [Planctomycetes bacterium GWC2_45_44]HBR20152.1 hypothetical protein [Phycisphaerales bacterium]
MNYKSDSFNISVYPVWQWWEEHYQKAYGRPSRIDFDWLDRTYLGRREFLHKHFGHIGTAGSEPLPEICSQIMPFHSMIIPVALGMEATIQEIGGYAWKNMSGEQLENLNPVNIAESFIGELILKQRQERIARYGTATQMIDLASVSNNAFMMRGPDFFVDLLTDKNFAHHYLGVITETMCMAYKFITETFGHIDGFPLGNCNVTMMSPKLYDEMICQYDVRCVEYAAKINGKEPCCDLHHCNVKTEPFAKSYRKIPGLRSLQGSYRSDIKKILETLPGVKFSAMVNPVELLNRPISDILFDIEQCIVDGANDLAIWDIDTACSPEMLGEFFEKIGEISEKHNKKMSLGIIPFSWEELAWEFPTYVN